MMNNGCREDNNNNSYCYFHPREAVIGVCPLCLNERLIILAATQRRRRSSRSAHEDVYVHNHSKKAPIQFHRIFDFGSLLHRFEFKSWKFDFDDRHDHNHDYYHDHDHDASTSQEDSFISIKFEENGNASWDKKKVCEEENSWALKNNNNNNNNNNNIANYYKNNKKSKREQNYEESQRVIEHGRPRGSSLRWRKRIGHVFHLIRWKRSTNKGSVCHVSNKVEGVKVRKRSWIRSLSKKTSFE